MSARTSQYLAPHRVVADPVYIAAAELLLAEGARKLRTAAIAEKAGVNESTLFRKYGGLTEILAKAYEWAWSEVNSAVALASFVHQETNPKQMLLSDTAAIWDMRRAPHTATAANFAFLLMRRRHELDLDEICESQILFEARLKGNCERVAEADGLAPEKADLLTALIMNYVATVFLTWLTMPQEGDAGNVFAPRDLSQDEAQFGILVLLERSQGL